MDFLYYMMEMAKKQINENNPKHTQEFINIIEHRWDYQIGRYLHIAGKHGFKNILKYIFFMLVKVYLISYEMYLQLII